MQWTKIGDELVYDGWFKILHRSFQTHDTKKHVFDIKDEADSVSVIAKTVCGEFVICKQFRPGPEKVLFEFPGGRVEKGENPLEAAQRELLEETGYVGTCKLVSQSFECGYSSKKKHVCVALDCRKVSELNLDADEDITVELVSLADLRRLLRTGESSDIAAGYLALDHLGSLAKNSVNLRPMVPSDWERVAAIYSEGLRTRNATFQTEVPAWKDWSQSHLGNARFVAVCEEAVSGWAALSAISSRSVYAGVAEVSIYVAQKFRGSGVGTSLLKHLIKESEKIGIWTLQAGIFPENTASINLHLSLGFRIVGTREKIGCLNGTWRDVCLLERRSQLPT